MPNRYENAGRLDRRITIQRATTAADDHGTPIETWVDVACCNAAMEYAATGSGEEQYDAVHLATTTVIFTIRWRPGVLQTDRIVYESNYYDITRISESAGPGKSAKQQPGRKAYWAITCELRK